MQYNKINLIITTLSSQDEVREHGVDWEEFVPERDPDEGHVVVTPPDCPLTQEQYTALCQSFDPLSMSDDCDGIDFYCAVRQFVCETT